MEYRLMRDLPVENGYDVVVAGGGPAGSAAAICAARLGAKVLLLEAGGCLGGMGTLGLVCAFDPMADGEKMLVGGFMRELVETLYDRGFMAPGINPDSWRKRYHEWSCFRPEGLKLVLDEMATDAGVKVRFFTRVADADAHDGIVNGVITSSVEGLHYISAPAFIDATGDAILSDYCGAAYIQAGLDTPNIMPATLPALFAGVDWTQNALQSQTPECVALIEQEYAQGNFTHCDRHFVGLWKNGETTGFLNGGHLFHLDATNVKSLSDGMVLGRRIVQEYAAFLQKHSPGSEHLELMATASVMGVRESRNIVGEYTLTYDDYLARRQFHDQIGVFNKFVDIHPYDFSRQEYDRFLAEKEAADQIRPGECFGIPYGILVPRGWRNLWVAGRCNSSDVKTSGAIRTMPACAMMGQAAGTAAVLALRAGCGAAELDTAVLVQTLRDAGAYLPQPELSPILTRTI